MKLDQYNLENLCDDIRNLDNDAEVKHKAFDALLLTIVRAEGYNRIADIFEAEMKWYS